MCPMGFGTHECVTGFDREAGRPYFNKECMDYYGLKEEDLLAGDDEEEDTRNEPIESDSNGATSSYVDESAQKPDEQHVSPCSRYWGYPASEGDDWVQGVWDEATGEEGQHFVKCTSDAKSNWTELYAPDDIENSHYLRLQVDHVCVSSVLCKIEHSIGWCSSYYTKEVLKTCEPDSYRDIFCTEVCPGEGHFTDAA